MFPDSTIEEVNQIMQQSWSAFLVYRNYSLNQRATLMRSVAKEIENLGDALIATAARETNLPKARLLGERNRTVFQLNAYAEACERGNWQDIRINTAQPDSQPPKPDLRKMQIPLGPVVVFGAANFPFAYSTAGGDTASALAAGCTVVVKAHPAHAETSELVATAISKALDFCKMPADIFCHIHGKSFEVGKALIEHPHSSAVGFTGSFSGGKQLFDWANQRKVPIPVFAEMSSINPVFLLPQKMQTEAAAIATQYAASITLGVGQFCTNPGLLVGIKGEALQLFKDTLQKEIESCQPAAMLHEGIGNNYNQKRTEVLAQPKVHTVAVSKTSAAVNEGQPTIATVDAVDFIGNPVLHQEVFGPFSLLIECNDKAEMQQVAEKMEGQLTATIMATNDDVLQHAELTDTLKHLCGRFILNGVPTGVEVCLSMQHGGPFPSTTDSRFSSVGADAIRRFTRPIAYQNWSNELLPDELKDENPLGIWRTVNDELSKDPILR